MWIVMAVGPTESSKPSMVWSVEVLGNFLPGLQFRSTVWQNQSCRPDGGSVVQMVMVDGGAVAWMVMAVGRRVN